MLATCADFRSSQVVVETNTPVELDDRSIFNDVIPMKLVNVFNIGASLVRDLVDDLLDQDLRGILCFKQLVERVRTTRLASYSTSWHLKSTLIPNRRRKRCKQSGPSAILLLEQYL
jgi:hypothetical protein